MKKIRDADKKIGQLDDGAQQVADGASDLHSGLVKLDKGAGDLAKGAGDLHDGAVALKDGTAKAKDGVGQLKDGSSQLAKGATDLDKGAGKLDDGSGELADGLTKGAEQIPTYDKEDREKRSDVVAVPVDAEKVKNNAVSTYGEGLAAFFISLALWIGGMITYMVLNAIPYRALASTAKSNRIAWAAMCRVSSSASRRSPSSTGCCGSPSTSPPGHGSAPSCSRSSSRPASTRCTSSA